MDVMMGDLVLTQDEVNPVMSALLDNGFDVTALHNHFFWDEPRMFYMHLHGHGTAADLARKLKPAIDLIGPTAGAAASVPASGSAPPPRSRSTPASWSKIVGRMGEQTGPSLQVHAPPRADVKLVEMGATINARMGLNTWAAFTGTDDQGRHRRRRRHAGKRSDAGAAGAPQERSRGCGHSPPHDHRSTDDHLCPLLGDGTGRQARNRFQGRGERARQAWRRLDAMTTATDSLHSQEPSATSPLRSLGFDGRLLFATRFIRLFAYGGLSVVLVLYLVSLGLSESDTGLLLTARCSATPSSRCT